MNRRRRLTGGTDGGFALVDLVVGLALTAIGAGMVAVLVASATEGSAPSDQGRYDAALAADQFSRDVHEATQVSVVRRRGTDVRTLDLVGTSTTVRWTFSGERLTRADLSTIVVRVVLDGLDGSGGFTLQDGDGTPVDLGDAAAVRDCTRLVGVRLDDAEGTWALDRVVALRVGTGAQTCP